MCKSEALRREVEEEDKREQEEERLAAAGTKLLAEVRRGMTGVRLA